MDHSATIDELVNAMQKAVAVSAAELRLFETALEIKGLDRTGEIARLASERRAELAPILNFAARQGEAFVCAVFDWAIVHGGLGDDLGLHPGLVSMKREVHVPCGRIDRLLSHQDGSRTVVEVKPRGSRRDHACGIGQALMYSVAARDLYPEAEVRSALVVLGPRDPWIDAACASAGVAYVVIPSAVENLMRGISLAALGALA